MDYQIKHKLTKKMVLDHKTLKPIVFDNLKEAQARVDLKNKLMHADFYEIVAMIPDDWFQFHFITDEIDFQREQGEGCLDDLNLP